jgi:hypothetical protein
MTADLSLQDATGHRQATIVTFIAPVSGIGRTGVVANLAWILSSAGKRVLILDWGAKAPRVHEYLRPFHAESPAAGEILGDELLRMLAPLFGSELSRRMSAQQEPFPYLVAREYRIPREGCRIDVVVAVNPAGVIGHLLPQRVGDEGSVRLRELIRSVDYDYVLIDLPTASPELTALLSDVVAMFCNPRYEATMVVAEVARNIWDMAPVGLRFLAVAASFDDQDRHREQQTRSRMRNIFADLLTKSSSRDERNLSINIIEIPYQPYDYLFNEALATLLDEPGQERSLLAAYEELASAITQGAVDRLPPVSPHTRARYRYALGLGSLDRCNARLSAIY